MYQNTDIKLEENSITSRNISDTLSKITEEHQDTAITSNQKCIGGRPRRESERDRECPIFNLDGQRMICGKVARPCRV